MLLILEGWWGESKVLVEDGDLDGANEGYNKLSAITKLSIFN